MKAALARTIFRLCTSGELAWRLVLRRAPPPALASAALRFC
jgi:hypothetical protein